MSGGFETPCLVADERVWRAKAAAWLHDPGEKQLILFYRHHEKGNVRRLSELLLGKEAKQNLIPEADHWAAAADRPQFEFEGAHAPQIRFCKDGELVHPLAGLHFELGTLECDDDSLDALENEIFEKASRLLQKTLDRELRNDAATPDNADELRKALLALWRFLPEMAFAPEGLGHLWRLLPADSRVPDHSIWTHLDLASAIAGAFAADDDERLALLIVSIGPVQDFIAQARSTSDLWAGSHLLSHLALEAMKPLLCRFGPDAVIFPHLRGVPQVDAWLVREMGIPAELFDTIGVDWRQVKTDFNPLFVATLPNLFVAIVPQSQAEELAREAAEAAREAIRSLALDEVMSRLLDVAGIKDVPEMMIEQIEEQLRDFPEVHWAAVPWARRGESMEKAQEQLKELLVLLTGTQEGEEPGIFSQKFWKAFARKYDTNIFKYEPNAGLLYPAIYSALTRVQAAAKAVRPFQQTAQEGFRCTLCGEREWLTTEREHLHWTAAQRQTNAESGNRTLWWRIIKGGGKRSWVRRGDHLCAICASKRLWPDIFTDRIHGKTDDAENTEPLVKDDEFSRRFVVSTHTLALADDLKRIIQKPELRQKVIDVAETDTDFTNADTTALPRHLARYLEKVGTPELRKRIKQIPAYIDDLRNPPEREGRRDEQKLQQFLSSIGLDAHERYYALLLMDGDRMGAWLSAEKDAENYLLRVKERLHSAVVREAEKTAGKDALAYLKSLCPPSPARHVSISSALNGFALDLVRTVVEDLCNGKVIYAGGDDVLAMLTIEDALKAATTLRFLYSGHLPEGAKELLPDVWNNRTEQFEPFENRFDVEKGFVHDKWNKRLYMTMGPRATASAGLVIAHYLMPLSRALKELRATEKVAKDAGRNALAVRVIKRSGTVATAVGEWPKLAVEDGAIVEKTAFANTFPGLLARFAEAVRSKKLSRRVAYHTYQHIERLPDRKLSGLEEKSWNAMLEAMLVHQFKQQAQKQAQKKECHGEMTRLAHDIAAWACARNNPLHELREFLGVAEFLGRREDERGAQDNGGNDAPEAREAAA